MATEEAKNPEKKKVRFNFSDEEALIHMYDAGYSCGFRAGIGVGMFFGAVFTGCFFILADSKK